MKIGISLKLILKEPYLFRILIDLLRGHNHEVHVITGHGLDEAFVTLELAGIKDVQVFSINEELDRLGHVFIGHADRAKRRYYWDKTKASYCLQEGLDLHLDLETENDRYVSSEQLPFFKSPISIVKSSTLPVPTKKKLRVGFDLHGVVNSKPDFFRTLMALLKDNGHEVHVVTGRKQTKDQDEFEALQIPFTDFFSITDHHVSIGTPIKWDDKGDPDFDPFLWDSTKGAYAARVGLDLHFDDSDVYHRFCPCPYARFYSRDSERIVKTRI